MSRVMVVDDDTALLHTISRLLQRAGHEVAEAANGKDALAFMRAAPVDIVVTDLFMPDKDGLETICELHRDYPDVPIVAICGNRNGGLMLHAAKGLGAIRTLEKPFEPEALLRLITEELQRQRDKLGGEHAA